jgi:hypothetical protein
MIDWLVLGLGVPSQQKVLLRRGQMAKIGESFLANPNILALEVHKALATINTMAMMLNTLGPIEILGCYICTAIDVKREAYDSWVDLRDAFKKDFEMLNYGIFKSELSDMMNEASFDEICQIAYRKYFL